MAFDGSGNYSPPAAPTFPAITGTAISSSYYNAVVNDVSGALGNCLTRDGQGKPSAAINWNGQNLTGVAVFATTGAATIGGTLGVTGATTLTGTLASGALTVTGTLNTTGLATLASAAVTAGLTVGTTLGVTGATTLSSTLAAGATTITGTLSATSYITANVLRATGNSPPPTGAGVEIQYAAANGYIYSYDRTGAAWTALNISGTQINLQASGTNIVVITNAGATVTGSLSATDLSSGGLYNFGKAAAYVEAAVNLGQLYYNTIGGILTLDARSSGGTTEIQFRTSSGGTGATRVLVNATGLAVTGTLSATGNITSNSSFISTGASLYLSPAGSAIYAFEAAQFRPVVGGISLGTTGDPWAGLFTSTVNATSSIKSSSPTAGVGYSAGAGGTVTQATSKSTGVTLNKVSGQITTNNASIAAGTTVGFVVNNNTVAATDVIVLGIASGASSANSYTLTAASIGGSLFVIEIRNTTGGALAETLLINFAVIKSVTS